MVGVITHATTLNSFWSISFCVLALSLHSYATYLAVKRHKEAAARVWPTKGPGPPGEVASHLALVVLSCLLLPFFVIFSVLRVGNYANDGVKLGRDHALNPNLDAWCRKVRKPLVRRLWRGCVPLAQTVYLTAAFLLLLPDTLLTAVEVDYGYKTSDAAWSTDIDFLFPEERAHTSDIVASINLTNTVANGSRVVVPTPNPPPGGWGSDHSLSLVYVNFVLALLTFSVRYASVFWYTNKALTLVLGLWLLVLSLTAALGYSAFVCLYKVCHNRQLYLNVRLALGCQADLGLYLTGSAVMLLSTATIFEYGAHYFAEKMRIIERKHQRSNDESKSGAGTDSTESVVQPYTVLVHNGCQGYVPHSLAMAALVILAACKGPVLYDLVALFRLTADPLLLTGLVMEVAYLVLWIGLWFGLTVKQRWQFRILDYVPLGQPLFMIQEDQIMKNPCTFEHSANSGGGDCNSLELRETGRSERRHGGRSGHSPPRYLEAGDGTDRLTPDHDQTISETGTEDSDNANVHPAPGPHNGATGGAARKTRPGTGKRHGGPRVTFDESVHSNHHRDNGGITAADSDGSRHVNVRVDVHSSNSKHANAGEEDGKTASGDVVLRRQSSGTENTLTREYRNSIRSKCDDLYTVVDHNSAPGMNDGLNNLSPQPVDSAPAAGTVSAKDAEPLPTLMSSFRDKVKESSRTASNYREQRRHLQLGAYGSLDRQQPSGFVQGLTQPVSSGGSVHDVQGGDRRRGVVEAQVGDISLRLDDSLDSGVRSSQRTSTVSDADHHSHVFQHANSGPFLPPPQQLQHGPTSLTPNSNSVSFEPDPASVPSDGQSDLSVPSSGFPGAALGSHSNGVVSNKPPRQAARMDYLSLDKAGGSGYSRSLHIVPSRGGKAEIGRRDSANYSLTSSQETSSNDSDHGQGLCSQV